MIAPSVFLQINIVGMSRTEGIDDISIILAALIFIVFCLTRFDVFSL